MEFKIFDSLLEPVFALNDQGQVIYCNEPASIICEISVRKIIRSKPTFESLFNFAEPIEFLKNLTTLVDPSPYQEVDFKIGSEKSGRVQITAQKADQVQGQDTWIVFFRDVTLEETLQKKYKAEQAELEKYSRGLEIMVAERTVQITKLNQTMSALLDSLGQGFFLFSEAGDCLEVFSKACLQTVETTPFGQKIWEVLKLSEKQVPGFKKWMTTAFAEMLPFEDLAPLAPPDYNHSQGKKIQLQYYPLRSAEGKMEAVVVVSTDITELVEAQMTALNEKAHAQMIISLIQQKRYVQSFLQESESLIQEVKTEFQQPSVNADNLFRCLHTLKGGAATFSIKPMIEMAHQAESLLSQWKSEPTPKTFEQLKDKSLSVETKFRNFKTENESILGSAEKMKSRWVEVPVDKFWQFENKLPPALRAGFTETFLMEPVSVHFVQYNEVMKNVAEKEGKMLHPLKITNGELPILPEIYSQLFSTFVHAFRNAVDHGIETPDIRESLGKSHEGQIEVSFAQIQNQGSPWLEIKIQDDGGGIDPVKIRDRLTGKGLDISKEDDNQIIQHVFDSQFSTKTEVTETSGRGVGMDAILHAATKLGGKAYIVSQVGKGSCLVVQVPYLQNVSGLKAA